MTEKKLAASQLTGEHIGQTVRFLIDHDDTKVEHIVTGRLRTVGHGSNDTEITLGSQFAKSAEHFQLPPTRAVIVDPPGWEIKDIPDLRKVVKV